MQRFATTTSSAAGQRAAAAFSSSSSVRLAAAAARSSPRAGRNGAGAGRTYAIADFFNQGKMKLAKAQAGEYDAAAVRAKIDATNKSAPLVVYSWTGCPFCKKAKALLTELGANYVAVELDTLADGKALRAELAGITNQTSVPQIFLGGDKGAPKFLGGANDGGLGGVVTLNNRGELVPMLKAAGAL